MEAYDREILGASGGVDDVGVVTYVVPYYARSLMECRVVARGRVLDGLPEKSRTWSAGEGGIFTVSVVYQGSASEYGERVRYSLRGSMEEEAIEAHPQINQLMKKYNGRVKDGRVVFDPTYIEKEGGGGALDKGKSDAQKNPMYGVEKYKKLGLIWQRAYVAARIPASLVLRVGRVVNTPPGAPPELEGRSMWLVLEPSAESRGGVFEITEQYQLLDDDVPKLLYQSDRGE